MQKFVMDSNFQTATGGSRVTKHLRLSGKIKQCGSGDESNGSFFQNTSSSNSSSAGDSSSSEDSGSASSEDSSSEDFSSDDGDSEDEPDRHNGGNNPGFLNADKNRKRKNLEIAPPAQKFPRIDIVSENSEQHVCHSDPAPTSESIKHKGQAEFYEFSWRDDIKSCLVDAQNVCYLLNGEGGFCNLEQIHSALVSRGFCWFIQHEDVLRKSKLLSKVESDSLQTLFSGTLTPRKLLPPKSIIFIVLVEKSLGFFMEFVELTCNGLRRVPCFPGKINRYRKKYREEVDGLQLIAMRKMPGQGACNFSLLINQSERIALDEKLQAEDMNIPDDLIESLKYALNRSPLRWAHRRNDTNYTGLKLDKAMMSRGYVKLAVPSSRDSYYQCVSAQLNIHAVLSGEEPVWTAVAVRSELQVFLSACSQHQTFMGKLIPRLDRSFDGYHDLINHILPEACSQNNDTFDPKSRGGDELNYTVQLALGLGIKKSQVKSKYIMTNFQDKKEFKELRTAAGALGLNVSDFIQEMHIAQGADNTYSLWLHSEVYKKLLLLDSNISAMTKQFLLDNGVNLPEEASDSPREDSTGQALKLSKFVQTEEQMNPFLKQATFQQDLDNLKELLEKVEHNSDLYDLKQSMNQVLTGFENPGMGASELAYSRNKGLADRNQTLEMQLKEAQVSGERLRSELSKKNTDHHNFRNKTVKNWLIRDSGELLHLRAENKEVKSTIEKLESELIETGKRYNELVREKEQERSAKEELLGRVERQGEEKCLLISVIEKERMEQQRQKREWLAEKATSLRRLELASESVVSSKNEYRMVTSAKDHAEAESDRLKNRLVLAKRQLDDKIKEKNEREKKLKTQSAYQKRKLAERQRKQVTSLRQNIRQLEKKLDVEKGKTEQLAKKIEESKEVTLDLTCTRDVLLERESNHQKALDGLMAQLQQRDIDKTRLVQQLKAVSEVAISFKCGYDAATSAKNCAETESNQLKNRLHTVELELKGKVKEKTELARTLKKARADCQKKRVTQWQRKQMASLQQNIRQLEKKLSVKEGKTKQLSKKNEELKEITSDLICTRDTLLEGVANHQKALDDLNAQLLQRDADKIRLVQQVEFQCQELTLLQADLMDLREDVERREALEERLKEVQIHAQQQSTKIQRVQKELDVREASLRKAHLESDRREESLQQDKASALRRVVELETNLTESEAARQRAEASCQSSQQHLSDNKKIVSVLEEQLTSALQHENKEHEVHETEIEQLKQRIMDAEESFNAEQGHRMLLEYKVIKSRALIEHLDAVVQRLDCDGEIQQAGLEHRIRQLFSRVGKLVNSLAGHKISGHHATDSCLGETIEPVLPEYEKTMADTFWQECYTSETPMFTDSGSEHSIHAEPARADSPVVPQTHQWDNIVTPQESTTLPQRAEDEVDSTSSLPHGVENMIHRDSPHTVSALKIRKSTRVRRQVDRLGTFPYLRPVRCFEKNDRVAETQDPDSFISACEGVFCTELGSDSKGYRDAESEISSEPEPDSTLVITHEERRFDSCPIREIEETAPKSKDYLRVIAKYALKRTERGAAAISLNTRKILLPVWDISPFKPCQRWLASHINYLAWKYPDAVPDKKKKIYFDNSKKVFKKTLKLLNHNHSDYEALLIDNLLLMLDIKERKVVWNERERRRYAYLGNSMSNDELKFPVKFQVAQPRYERWGSEAIREFLKSHDVVFQSGSVKITGAAPAKELIALLPSSTEYKKKLFEIVKERCFDIRKALNSLNQWTSSHEKELQNPTVDDDELPEKLSSYGLFLGIIIYRKGFCDLPLEVVTLNRAYYALKNLEGKPNYVELYKAFLSIVYHHYPEEHSLQLALYKATRVWHKGVQETRKTLPDVEFETVILKPDGNKINKR